MVEEGFPIKFLAEWPPNTDGSEKDKEIVEDVKTRLSCNHKVYMLKRKLELKGGIVVKKRYGTGKLHIGSFNRKAEEVNSYL
ncbi:MAG: hypothetical protein QW506_02745 [Thermoproteota archaeon]